MCGVGERKSGELQPVSKQVGRLFLRRKRCSLLWYALNFLGWCVSYYLSCLFLASCTDRMLEKADKEFSPLALHSLRMLLLCLKGLAVAIVTLSDVRTPTLVIDVDAIASDRSLEQLVPDVLTC